MWEKHKHFFILNFRCGTHDKVPSRSNRRQRETTREGSNNALWLILTMTESGPEDWETEGYEV